MRYTQYCIELSTDVSCTPKLVWVLPGTRVSTFLFPFYRHYGVVTETGLVLSCSARSGRAVAETFAVFSGGQDWRVEPPLSDLPRWMVLARAYEFADRGYHVSNWNCETYVNVCFGLPPRSRQAELTVAAAGLGLIAYAASRLAA